MTPPKPSSLTAQVPLSPCSSTPVRRISMSFPWQCEPGWNVPTAASCYHPRPRPGRRRRAGVSGYQNKSASSSSSRTFRSGRPWMRVSMPECSVLMWLVFVLFCCRTVHAVPAVYANERVWEETVSTELLFDRSEPPSLGWMLQRRDGLENRDPQQPGDNGLQVADPGSQIALPRPFDSSLGNNFTTDSCPQFFNDFLTNQTFLDCLPFSLLLQTSNGFFTTLRTPSLLAQTLDKTCSAPLPTCSALMTSLAAQIQDPSTCGADLAISNPTVLQAYAGLTAYEPLYHASCLRDPTTGNYCFANAVTNASAPGGSYIYYLPLGVELPAGEVGLACDECLESTMSGFAQWAGNSSEPLNVDFGAAVEKVDAACGAGFVQDVFPAAATGASTRMVVPASFGFAVAVGLILFLL